MSSVLFIDMISRLGKILSGKQYLVWSQRYLDSWSATQFSFPKQKYYSDDWKYLRLLFIGHYKELAAHCLLATLPKELIVSILHFYLASKFQEELESFYNARNFNINGMEPVDGRDSNA